MLNFADAVASHTHPFVGLRPFQFEDAAFFFGREEQIAALEAKIRVEKLVSVVGSSGSGKSSLVLAGLLPRLPTEHWDWVSMRPGDDPVSNLRTALLDLNDIRAARLRAAGQEPEAEATAHARRLQIAVALESSSFGIREAIDFLPGDDGRRTLILIDQFEEIFRFADLRERHNMDPRRASKQRDEATFFVQLLLNAVGDEDFNGAIVLTMRSDFIGECGRFFGLAEAVTRTQYLVPSLTREQRAATIRDPIRKAGGTIEPELVQRLLNDTNEDPDQLPVLQHVMMRCWQRAAGSGLDGAPHLTPDIYRDVGGIDGALAQHGEQMLEAIRATAPPPGSPPLDLVTQRCFQALTDMDSNGRTIRRPQSLDALAAVLTPADASEATKDAITEAVRAVVLRFADPYCSFLRAPKDLPPDAVIDIGHEALIRRWGKLGSLGEKSWVKTEQEDGENYRELLRSAQHNATLPPERFEPLERWWHDRQPTPAWARRYTPKGEDLFAKAESVLARTRLQAEANRVAKRNSRIVILSASALAIVALFILVSYVAWTNYQANQQAQTDQRTAADRRVALIDKAGLMRLDTMSAHEAASLAEFTLRPIQPLIPESEVLAYQILQHLYEISVLKAANCLPPAIAFEPDGKLLAYFNMILRERAQSGFDKVVSPRTHIQFGELLSPSPDGQEVLVGSIFDGVLLVDPKHQKSVDLGRVGSAAFSPDGGTIVTSGSESVPLRQWTVRPASDPNGPAVIDPRSLADNDNNLQPGTIVALSSRYLAIGQRNGDVQVIDWPDLKLRPLTLPYPDAGRRVPTPPRSLSFDPTRPDRILVTYSPGDEGSAYIWEVEQNASGLTTAAPPIELRAKDPIFRAVFSPDGRYIAAVARDNRVRVWDVQQVMKNGSTREPAIEMWGSGGPFWSVAFGLNDRLATGASNGDVWVWDLAPALSRGLPEPPSGPATGRQWQAQVRDEPKPDDLDQNFHVLPGPPWALDGLWIPDGGGNGAGATFTIVDEGDSKHVAAVPNHGAILLFEPATSPRPVAALGYDVAGWDSVHFVNESAGNRIEAHGKTDDSWHAWRVFRDRDELHDFLQREVSQIDKSAKFDMADTITGPFWHNMQQVQAEPFDQTCHQDRGPR